MPSEATRLIAIDPGTVQSACLWFDGDGILHIHGIVGNHQLLSWIREITPAAGSASAYCLVIEEIESYGMPVGREVFETVRWTGRFHQAYLPGPVFWLPRRHVKLYLCGNCRAKDGNVSQAIRDRYGGNKAAKGRKKTPGPLYHVKKDLWAALGVALTAAAILRGEYPVPEHWTGTEPAPLAPAAGEVRT
jgi:hypothetical protein